jgi:uncharacterized membrane protein
MMSSWWEDWWGTIGLGGALSGKSEKTGQKIGEKAGDKINDVTGLPDASGAFSALNDGVSFGKAVWLNLSDYRMWRSLGWLLLGIVLMIIGFVVWNKKAIASVGKLAAL